MRITKTMKMLSSLSHMPTPEEQKRLNGDKERETYGNGKSAWKRDAIDDYMTLDAVVKHNGIDKAESLRRYAKTRVLLDEKTDAEIPDWAYRLLKMRPLSFKARVYIIIAHHDRIMLAKRRAEYAKRRVEGEVNKPLAEVPEAVKGHDEATGES